MGLDKKKKYKIVELVVALVLVLFGGVLFVGVVSGWFDDTKVALSEEYYCENCTGELIELNVDEYEELIAEKKSFVVVIDQGGCKTAEHLKSYVSKYALEKGFTAYKMMFSELKKSSLHEKVKYYPSFAIIARGKVFNFLRADSDEDAPMYNSYEAFSEWVKKYL